MDRGNLGGQVGLVLLHRGSQLNSSLPLDPHDNTHLQTKRNKVRPDTNTVLISRSDRTPCSLYSTCVLSRLTSGTSWAVGGKLQPGGGVGGVGSILTQVGIGGVTWAVGEGRTRDGSTAIAWTVGTCGARNTALHSRIRLVST